MGKNYLLLFDIDGTLIDFEHNKNSDNLSQDLDALRADVAGIFLGINSNRAFEDIISYYEEFHMNGPMIIENGAYFKQDKAAPIMHLQEGSKEITGEVIDYIKDFISKYPIKLNFALEDTSAFILDTSKDSNNVPTVVVNGFRKFSGSIHVYKGNTPQISIASELRDYIAIKLPADYFISKANEGANFVINHQHFNKGTGVERFLKLSPLKYDKVYMVGDSKSDLDTIPFIDGFFAVSNSSDLVKSKSNFVSKYPYTLGVIEIVEYIRNMLLEKNRG